MKFKKHGGDSEDSVVIDLTALVDVLFVLVLFFVVSTTFSSTSEMEVNLPSVKQSSHTEQTAAEAEINISAAGIIDVRGKKIAHNEEIPAAIHQDGKANSVIPVLIKADKKVSHGVVIGVLDELKRNGFEQVAIATDSSGTGS